MTEFKENDPMVATIIKVVEHLCREYRLTATKRERMAMCMGMWVQLVTNFQLKAQQPNQPIPAINVDWRDFLDLLRETENE